LLLQAAAQAGGESYAVGGALTVELATLPGCIEVSMRQGPPDTPQQAPSPLKLEPVAAIERHGIRSGLGLFVANYLVRELGGQLESRLEDSTQRAVMLRLPFQ
jgi:hypothetical protein